MIAWAAGAMPRWIAPIARSPQRIVGELNSTPSISEQPDAPLTKRSSARTGS